MKFNFHDAKSSQFCGAKYFDLRDEMLSNSLHALSIGDFNSIYNRATELMQCDEGCKSMISQRACYGIPRGTRITVEHIIVILTRCNYSEIILKFDEHQWLEMNKR